MYIPCASVADLEDRGIPLALRYTRGQRKKIQIFRRIETSDANTWDVFLILGIEYLGRDQEVIFADESRDGHIRRKLDEYRSYGDDIHIYLYSLCSTETFIQLEEGK